MTSNEMKFDSGSEELNKKIEQWLQWDKVSRRFEKFD